MGLDTCFGDNRGQRTSNPDIRKNRSLTPFVSSGTGGSRPAGVANSSLFHELDSADLVAGDRVIEACE
jgi:hypothetical protein